MKRLSWDYGLNATAPLFAFPGDSGILVVAAPRGHEAAATNGKRKVVVRERGGNSVPAVFKSEAKAMAFLRAHIAKGTILNADEAGSWAEEFFSRMRRAEIGHHHHIAGAYLLRYAQEASWREDNRRVSNGDQVQRLTGLALTQKPSVDFGGYWQRHLENPN